MTPRPLRSSPTQRPDDRSVLEALKSLEKAVRDLEPHLRTQAYSTALKWLRPIFKDGKQLLAYELSDGKRSTRQIAQHIRVDQKTVSTWWRTWQSEFKIVEKVGNRGQFRALYPLADLIALFGNPPDSASSGEQVKPSK